MDTQKNSSTKTTLFKQPQPAKQSKPDPFEKTLRQLNAIFYRIGQLNENSTNESSVLSREQFLELLKKYKVRFSEHKEAEKDPKTKEEKEYLKKDIAIVDKFLAFANKEKNLRFNNPKEITHGYTSNPSSLSDLALTPFIGKKQGSALANKNLVMGLITKFKINHSKSIDLSYRVDFDEKVGLHVNLCIDHAKFAIPVGSANKHFHVNIEDLNLAAQGTKYKFWIKMSLSFYKQDNKKSLLAKLFSIADEKDKKTFEKHLFENAKKENIKISKGTHILQQITEDTTLRHIFIDAAVHVLSKLAVPVAEPNSVDSEINSETPCSL